MSRAAALPVEPEPVSDAVREAMAISLRGCEELLPQADWLKKLAARRGHWRAAAHQAGPGPDRARHPHRPHRGAEQDAPVAGSGAHGDLPDRRLHLDDRRPLGPQQHAPAADARADRGQRADLLRPGQPGARPDQDRDSLQQRVERCAGRARHDPAGLALHRGAHAGARRLHQALPRGHADQRARVAVPVDAGLRLGGAEERPRTRRHRPEVQPAGRPQRCRANTARSRSAS